MYEHSTGLSYSRNQSREAQGGLAPRFTTRETGVKTIQLPLNVELCEVAWEAPADLDIIQVDPFGEDDKHQAAGSLRGGKSWPSFTHSCNCESPLNRYPQFSAPLRIYGKVRSGRGEKALPTASGVNPPSANQRWDLTDWVCRPASSTWPDGVPPAKMDQQRNHAGSGPWNDWLWLAFSAHLALFCSLACTGLDAARPPPIICRHTSLLRQQFK
ncbi:hypothetical protein SCAR479_13085 [Seiridium cardinale]|uniref:Uncharacterized protein n=1 Tax=Seiridium cardinale TaxID=138064 RepID=A0ABR2X9B7_9PEZI